MSPVTVPSPIPIAELAKSKSAVSANSASVRTVSNQSSSWSSWVDSEETPVTGKPASSFLMGDPSGKDIEGPDSSACGSSVSKPNTSNSLKDRNSVVRASIEAAESARNSVAKPDPAKSTRTSITNERPTMVVELGQKPKTRTVFSKADPRFQDLVKSADKDKNVTIVDGLNVMPRNPSKSYPHVSAGSSRPTNQKQDNNQYQNHYHCPSVPEVKRPLQTVPKEITSQVPIQATQPVKTRNIFSKADPRFQDLVNGADKNQEVIIVDGSNVLPRRQAAEGKRKLTKKEKKAQESSNWSLNSSTKGNNYQPNYQPPETKKATVHLYMDF
jgi:hypothetical protein